MSEQTASPMRLAAIDELKALRADNTRLQAICNQCYTDEQGELANIHKFADGHTLKGLDHHSIFEWLEWLWSQHTDNARKDAEIARLVGEVESLRNTAKPTAPAHQ